MLLSVAPAMERRIDFGANVPPCGCRSFIRTARRVCLHSSSGGAPAATLDVPSRLLLSFTLTFSPSRPVSLSLCSSSSRHSFSFLAGSDWQRRDQAGNFSVPRTIGRFVRTPVKLMHTSNRAKPVYGSQAAVRCYCLELLFLSC